MSVFDDALTVPSALSVKVAPAEPVASMRIITLFVLNAGFNLGLGLAIAAILGPGDYGRFAIGMTVAVVLATGAFDWLRLSATRFYGEATRGAEPDLRATLDGSYLALAGFLVVALVLALATGVNFGLGAGLLAAAVFCGLANGLFDYQAALARARFHDRAYAGLVIVKNVAALGLGVGAALTVKEPALVLAATAAGGVVAVLTVARGLRDPAAVLGLARLRRLKGFATYGLPVVTANVVFQLVVLMNRSAAAATLGYAEAGRLSLATDLGLRLFLAVGAAVDVFVFQLAVRREGESGPAAAAAQLRTNAVVVVAILLLLGVGYAMAMPAFEALFVPERYRGAFATLSLILLPGLVLFCIGQFAINPVFQMAGRTGPVVISALITLAADGVGLGVLPRDTGAVGIAIVHSASLSLGALTILALALRRTDALRWTSDLSHVILAAALTALAMWPMRLIAPAWLALALATLAGTATFGATLLVLDVAGVRTMLITRLGAPRRGAPQGT